MFYEFLATYEVESDIEDEDRALIKEDNPLMPPIPPYQPHTQQLT